MVKKWKTYLRNKPYQEKYKKTEKGRVAMNKAQRTYRLKKLMRQLKSNICEYHLKKNQPCPFKNAFICYQIRGGRKATGHNYAPAFFAVPFQRRRL